MKTMRRCDEDDEVLRAYEEARGRANLGGLRTGILLSAVMLMFPPGCWLLCEGWSFTGWAIQGPKAWGGLLLMVVAGFSAEAACKEAVRTARWNAEAARLRWQAAAIRSPWRG